MDTKRLCPSCQKPLASNVPMGLCPECLIKAGFPTGVETDTGSAKQPAFVPPTVEEIAKLFPQLEILGLVGRGGMGAVYKARQKQLNRFVALKILPPGIGGEPAFAERFTREAQALAQLNHPGIVTLYEFGETSGQFYFLMEFVDGVNLRQLLAGSRVSSREALAIVPQICDALQFAHDQGIVHRDIKPENILLDRRGRVKVADFGLAKIIENRDDGTKSSASENIPGNLTDAGKTMGTPQYMSPEQITAPGEVDNRADIYALGVVFYQMLTGELPGKKILPPSAKVQIDVRLDEIVLRALEKNPALRYQQVSEVKTCVETIAATPDSSRPSPAMLKSERARLAVQESLAANVKYPAMGEVALFADRLLISSGYQQRSIPLTDIRGLGEAVMPFWFSPGPHRYASVAFDEAGQRRHLVFLAGSSLFRLPGDTRLHAAEWLTAIQRAVKSASGCEVPITQVPTVVPVKTWWTLLWLAVPLVAFLPLLAKFLLVPQREPAGSSLLDVVLFSGAFLLVPALALFVVYVVRSISLRHTKLKPIGVDARGTDVPPVEPRCSPTDNVGTAMSGPALGQAIRARMNPVEKVKFEKIKTICLLATFVPPMILALSGLWFDASSGLAVIIKDVVGALWGPAIVVALCLNTKFLASTEWAKQQGIRHAQLWFFSFKRGQRESETGANALPRFSRTAIVGACGMGVTLLAVLLGMIVQGQPAKTWMAMSQIEKVGFVFADTVVLPACLAPFITTILGWMAVSQIRRSSGKIYGLWLAVFDGLFFPLLALDYGIAWFLGELGVALHFWTHNYDPTSNAAFTVCSIWTWLVVDFLIIRRVWRAVNQPAGAPISESSQQKPGTAQDIFRQPFEQVFGPKKPRHFWRWIVIFCVALAAILVILTAWNLSSKRAVEAQQQMRGALQNELGNKLAELLGDNEQRITYSHFTFDFVADAPCIVVQFGGLKGWPGGTQNGAPRPLHGEFVLNFQSPNLWQVSGTGDLAGINTSLTTTAPGFIWWSDSRFKQQKLGEQSVLSASFAPVVELTLPMDEKGLTDLLDPDTGAVSASPNPPNMAQGLALLSKAGLVISRDEQKNETVLMGMNGVLAQESTADQWDKITNQQALDGIRKNYMSHGGMLGAVAHGSPPQTFLFKSATGKIGILQITGFTDNPRGVKIRYKLVQNGGNDSSQSIKPAGIINFKFLRVEVPKDSHRIELYFERDTNYGLGIEVTQNALPGPNGESIPLDFWRQYGHQSKWVGLHSPNVLVWRLPAELTGDEIQAGVKELEQNARQWTQLYEGSNPEFAHIKSHEGWTYILWSHVLREPDLPPSASDQAAEQILSFGPVMDLTLPDPATNTACVLDFESGRLLTPPDALIETFAKGIPQIDSAGMKWLRANGGDAVLNRPDIFSVRFIDGSSASPNGLNWDAITPDMLVAVGRDLQNQVIETEHDGNPGFRASSAVAPAVDCFVTRDGSMGVMEILGRATNPPGVKIRYKLVQNNLTTVTRVSLPPAAQPSRSQSPIIMQTGTNNQSVCVVHDNVDAQYTLFFDGNFKSFTSRGWHSPQQGNWQDDIAITLANGDRAFSFLRESFNPDQLRVNGQEYDLRQGRLFVLNSDGNIRQMSLFPPLIVSQRADQVAKLVGTSLTNAGKLKFGPVMERTLIDSKNSFENEAERTNAMIMIDLDIGSLLSGSQAMWDAGTDAQKRWMQTNGVDALCVVPGVGGLVGLDMKTLSVPPPTWDEVSMTMLNQLVGSPRQETVSLTLPLPTAYALQNAKEAAAPTWLFQTREGAMGVLQITGFTDNPRGVKIRYKLVQNPSLNL